MKRGYLFCIIVFISIFMFGCNLGAPNSEPGMIGKVTDRNESRILVVATVINDYSSNGGVAEHYNAIWFSNIPESIQLGDEVKVWYDLVMESYPGQSEAKYVEVVQSLQPEGAALTESEALNEALKSLEPNMATAVRTIEYDNNANIWQVKLKNIMDDEEFEIEVEDK
ncbi:DUF3221 domain-containing protein [Bacillaceae bacterium IKA-2]|jgi:hypothetical protein|nr:DUF3221 domain-containing protein [Bacillaceae bacterium IKA-2]